NKCRVSACRGSTSTITHDAQARLARADPCPVWTQRVTVGIAYVIHDRGVPLRTPCAGATAAAAIHLPGARPFDQFTTTCAAISLRGHACRSRDGQETPALGNSKSAICRMVIASRVNSVNISRPPHG